MSRRSLVTFRSADCDFRPYLMTSKPPASKDFPLTPSKRLPFVQHGVDRIGFFLMKRSSHSPSGFRLLFRGAVSNDLSKGTNYETHRPFGSDGSQRTCG